jgi:hypothetical protein
VSSDSEFTRRVFVMGAISTAAVATVAASALLTPAQRASGEIAPARPAANESASAATARLLVFDPEHADACQRVAGGAGKGCTTLPVTGDRVRFGRELFGSKNAPAVVAGLTHYADYILLSGCAAEHGYRVQSAQVQPRLVEWTVAQTRRATSS